MKNGTSKLECGGPLLLRVHKRRSWRKPLLDTLRLTASGGADHTMRSENEIPARHQLDVEVGYYIIKSVFSTHVKVQARFKTEAKDAETN
ncbi:hypothetical protein DPX16_7194 [Anabarilius grahami]|uniref:Uncharacterized protein n=1 Tax=Anabarilius grahami TaxID=495550 RepID=A0A3N0XMP2_ANAGA|nr:hypothetical protein DPX16_7194 [Anabarilius grahami]